MGILLIRISRSNSKEGRRNYTKLFFMSENLNKIFLIVFELLRIFQVLCNPFIGSGIMNDRLKILLNSLSKRMNQTNYVVRDK